MLLALTGLGPLACFGGPTSDFPNKAEDGDGTPARPGGGNDGDNNNNNGGDGEDSTGGGNSSGGAGSGSMDAGTAAPDDSGGDGGEAGTPACTWSTYPVDAASCGGSHCALSRAELTVAPGVACEPAETLDAVCSGDAQRVVHACWRSNTASLDRINAVTTCASNDPLLASFGAGCLSCYVALHECLSSACAVECGTEASGECESCTNQKCVPAFTSCSGLLTP